MAALAVAGCAPGGSVADTNASSGAAVASGAGGEVTLTVADGWGEKGTGEAFAAVIKDFEQSHPNIKIDRQTTDYTSYQDSVILKGSSPNPPDVMMLEDAGYGQGFYKLASSNLLLPLDKYADKYNWNDRFGTPKSLNVFRFNTDQDQWGEGQLYGVPEQNALIGVFYNKTLAKKIGMSGPPTSFDEFEQSLAKAKDQGVTGITEAADPSQSTFIYTEMALWASFAKSDDDINNWIYGKSGTFANPENLKAAQTIQEWEKQGYFQAGAVSMNASDAIAQFLNGQSLYYIGGSWQSGGVDSKMGNEAGWFLIPGQADQSPAGGGLTTPLAISAKTKHPDQAAEFLDYFTSKSASKTLFQNDWGLPGGTVSSTLAPSGSTTATIIDKAAEVEGPDGGGTIPFLNWATPKLTASLPAALQELVGGKLTPQQYVDQIQSDWEAFHHKG